MVLRSHIQHTTHKRPLILLVYRWRTRGWTCSTLLTFLPILPLLERGVDCVQRPGVFRWYGIEHCEAYWGCAIFAWDAIYRRCWTHVCKCFRVYTYIAPLICCAFLSLIHLYIYTIDPGNSIPFVPNHTFPWTTSTPRLFTQRELKSFACTVHFWLMRDSEREWTCILSAMMELVSPVMISALLWPMLMA